MKKQLVLISLCALALTGHLPAQAPPVPPTPPTATPAPPVPPPPATTPAVFPSPTPAFTASPSPAGLDEREIERRIEQRIDDRLEREIERRIERTIEEEIEPVVERVAHAGETWAPLIISAVWAVFLTPVLIVSLILFFSFWKTRQMHRTVRMMVEKGQPVPPEMLSAPAGAPAGTVKPKNDLRRGIILLTVGLGIMFFFAAFDGPWGLGVIPFMIGVGYLLVSKMDPIKKDVPPPLP